MVFGGDGANTVNISTGASILAAACGTKIAKQGNRSSSSACGSADVLEELGIVIDLEPEADVDNSGTIDYGEFVAATLHLNKIEREDHLFAAFSYFDKDGSGYITQDELQHACEEFGVEDVRLEEMMQEVDQDNDGRIDYNEFVAMMQKGTIGGPAKKGLQNSFSIAFREGRKL